MIDTLCKDFAMNHIDRLLKNAVSNEVFPGAVLLVSIGGAVVFFEAYGFANLFSKRKMTRETVFDLASLTKALATTPAIMTLMQQSRLSLKQSLGTIISLFKGTDKETVRIDQLLYHNSGFPDYRPYYQQLCKLDQIRRKAALREFLVKEPLIHPPGTQVTYSDLGFMVLCWVIEEISGTRLDYFVTENIFRSLGLNTLFFIPKDMKPPRTEFAATEKCPWRNILLDGAVHDDNAYVVGGIEGHAGLFGTAKDIHSLLSELWKAYRGSPSTGVFESDWVQKFFKRQESSGRVLGFDTPSSIVPSCGRYFSKQTVGHLGFTGTSFWMDLERSIIIIFLTNRIHPSRDNNKIKDFRPKLHDTVMKRLLG